MNLLEFEFAPIINIWILAFFLVLYLIILAIKILQKEKLNFFHIGASLLLFIYCLSPIINKEKYIEAPINIGIIRDYSPSIIVTNRVNGIKNIEQTLLAKLKEFENNKIIDETIAPNSNKTDYLEAIEKITQKANSNQIGAIFIISDGQTQINKGLGFNFPIHQLIAGSQNENDFYIELISKPNPVKIGETTKLEFIIKNDKQKFGTTQARIYLNDEIQQIDVKLNEKTSFDIKITKRNEIKIAIEAVGIDDEITKVNNAIITSVKPIEESLKVLLVTGEPYEGARAWRNLLKSDPSIDLIHFTILRSPQKLDNALQSELALIPFPTEELFLNKLENFDLVIFDRFENLVGLRPIYMENIEKYVANGGAFLASLGPRDALGQGLMATSLRNILPIEGDLTQIDGEFKPNLSEIGKIHPISSQLNEDWGKWDRYFKTKAKGQVLLEANQSPLLIVDKYKNGRVGVILSDKSWYWQRNYDGGGPFRELIGRTFYWLMGDEKLSENQLNLLHKDYSIIFDYNFINMPNIITIDGQGFSQNISLSNIEKNSIKREFNGLPFGLYRANVDGNVAFANNGQFDETIAKSLAANGQDFLNSLENKNNSKISYLGIKGDGKIAKIEIAPNQINTLNDNFYILNKRQKIATDKISQSALNPYIMIIIILLLYFIAWNWAQLFRKKHS